MAGGDLEKAAGEAASGAGTFLKNNFLPFHATSRVGKNFLWVTAFTGIGMGAAFAGATLPLSTSVSTLVATSGTAATAANTTAAATISAITPTSGFWSTTGSVMGEYFSHAANGIAWTGGEAIDIIKNGNWSEAATHVGNAATALTATP